MKIRLKCNTCGWQAEAEQADLPKHPIELIKPGDCHRIDATPIMAYKPAYKPKPKEPGASER